MPQPLVEPGPPLAPARLARYARQLALPGHTPETQQRLANARVLIIGAGGLGSATIPLLASTGIGTNGRGKIGVIDTDTVELSNLHRQTAHSMSDIGRPKLDSLRDTIHNIDPDVRYVPHPVRITTDNALEIFSGYDLVLDGSDNFPTRYLVADAAELAGIPLIWGSILGYQGQTSISWATEGPRYRDLFPTPPPPGAIPSCATGGVTPSVCAVIGGLMHAETIKLITGHGQPLIGTLTSYDALTGRVRTLDYARDPNTPPITELTDYEQFCGVTSQPTTETSTADAPATASDRQLSADETPDSIEPRELAELLRTGAPLQLIDIREPYEHAIAAIDGAELIPMGTLPSQLGRIRTDIPVVLYCHHAVRSARVLDYLRDRGYDNVTHLAGGIDRYTLDAEPALARY